VVKIFLNAPLIFRGRILQIVPRPLSTDRQFPASDPNDGEFFSENVSARSYIDFEYDPTLHNPLIRSAKWTNRLGDLQIRGKTSPAKKGPSKSSAAKQAAVSQAAAKAALKGKPTKPKKVPTICSPPASTAIPDIYELDCAKFPNICENTCFYIFCEPDSRCIARDTDIVHR
jgi:hypothetical protein